MAYEMTDAPTVAEDQNEAIINWKILTWEDNMDQKQIFRQMMEFNKAAFDNNFKALVLFQSQSEQYILRFLEKSSWMPEAGKKAMSDWLHAYNKNYECFKASADENYRRAMDYVSTLRTPGDIQSQTNKGDAKKENMGSEE
jgi:hypothetical protein